MCGIGTLVKLMAVLSWSGLAIESRTISLTQGCRRAMAGGVVEGSIEGEICDRASHDDKGNSTRSYCKWTTEYDRDDNRIPSVLLKAVCLPKPRNDTKSIMHCEQVIRQIPVMRKIAGKYQWDLMELPVACAYAEKYHIN